jgi:hypothetical protein
MNITAQAAIQQVTDTLYAPFRYSGTGIPEGSQVSEPGWIYRDTNNGLLWFKKTGIRNTGWKALAGVLFCNTTTASSTGAASDVLQSDIIAGGTLAEDGDVIEFEYAGTISTGGATSLYLKLAGSSVIIQSVTPNGSGIPWRIWGTIVRKDANTMRVATSIVYGNDAGLTNKTDNYLYDVTAAAASNQTLILSTVFTAASKCSKSLGRAKLIPTT